MKNKPLQDINNSLKDWQKYLPLSSNTPCLSLALTCLLPFCFSPAQANVNAEAPSSQEWSDWIPNKRSNTVCQGYYMLPYFSKEALTREETIIEADRADFSKTGGQATLSGNVLVQQSNQRVDADLLYVHLNAQTNEIEQVDAFGHVLYEDPATRLFGRSAHFNLLEQRGSVLEAEFRTYNTHGRGRAERLSFQDEHLYNLYNGTYTTCAPEDNTWQLKAERVQLNTDKSKGEAWNSWLYLKGLPVFYVPYVTFPIGDKRKSGFLPPSFGTSSLSGFQYTQPYYLNLAPNYDATFTYNSFSDRGSLWEPEFHYLTENAFGDLSGAYIFHDRKYANFREEQTEYPSLPPYDPRLLALENSHDWRGGVSYYHASQFSEYLNGRVRFNWVSDDNFLDDFVIQLAPRMEDIDMRQLPRDVELNFQSQYWDVNGLVQDYQILQPFGGTIYDEPYRIVPKITALGFYPDVASVVDTQLYVEGARFDHSEDYLSKYKDIKERPTIGNRFVVIPTLTADLVKLPYAYVKPTAQLQANFYDLSLSPTDEFLDKSNNPSEAIPTFSLDSGLLFERELSGYLNGFSHTFEPRLFYLYIPYVNQNSNPVFDTSQNTFNFQQLFRMNAFSGMDRVQNANQLTYAASTRLISADTGIERARLSAGQIYYFANRRVSVCDTDIDPNCIYIDNPQADEAWSNFVAEGSYRFNRNWHVTSFIQWDPQSDDVSEFNIKFQYYFAEDRLVNLRYNTDKRAGLEKFNQTDFSFFWALNPQWRVIGRWIYDYRDRTTLEAFGGLEYESCCWAIRGGALREIATGSETERVIDNAIYFQVVLKGFTSLGNNFTSLIGAEVPGYVDRLKSATY